MKAAALLSLLGLMLVCPSALSGRDGVSTYNEPGEQRPRVERALMASCGSDHQNFCFNHGQCMLLVDTNEHHCKCKEGYSGLRCAHLELVFQPMKEEQLVLMGVCVALLIMGLSGAFYFYYKWYRKNRCPRTQKKQGYMGVERA